MAVTKPTTDIAAAVSILKQGGLVAFPTETVYGLGADAGNQKAVEKIFLAKQRPANHPLIVHLASVSQLQDWAAQISDTAWLLAETFWPGPLAIILKKQDSVLPEVTGGQSTVALRIPDNPVALELLQQFDDGIAAPSANLYNHISPTRAEHVISELGDCVDAVLDGGMCRVGLESTIIDMSGEAPRLLRPGHISPADIEQVIGQPVSMKQQTAVRAPGMREIHYAPTTPAQLCQREQLAGEIKKCLQAGQSIGLLTTGDYPIENRQVKQLSMPDKPVQYAHELYASLRYLDDMKLDRILVETVPETKDWLAVNDRLAKATARGG